MSFFGEIGINLNEVEELNKPQVVSTGGLLAPGAYLMSIDKVYAQKVDSGAVKVTAEFVFKREDDSEGKFFWSGYVASGDQKGNKATYTDRNGKEHPLPDVVMFRYLCLSAGIEDPKTKDATIEIFNEQVNVKAMPELTGKQVIVGVRHKYDDYREKDVTFVDTFLDKDGKNSKGDDMLEALKQKIEKSPVLKPKKKAEQKPAENTNNNGTLEANPWA